MIAVMVRLLTAGESHGKGLVAVVEGLPAGIPVRVADLAAELARRRKGYGRSGRQRLEADPVEMLGGVRHGRTLGSPIAVTIANAEWESKYRHRMGVEGSGDPAERLTAVRPGHADLAGMQKYGFDDARNVLERASARETAARAAAGYFCKAFLDALGVSVLSHVVRIGGAAVPAAVGRRRPPVPGDLPKIDRDAVRCADPATSGRMVVAIRAAQRSRDTLGGVFEVLAYGVPPGLGSHVQFDRKLDARLAFALMSIQSVKGVEVGDGFASAARPGSRAHDELVAGESALRPRRLSNRAGGIEGGMSTGEPIRLRAAMKPFSTVPKGLRTVDTATGSAAKPFAQRTDVCAVPAGGVVGEAVVAVVLANAALEKFGGDSVPEARRNLDGYLESLEAAR
jgi:chorismate synthase